MKFNKKWLWLIVPIMIFSLVCLNTSSVSTVLLAIQGAITDGNLVKFSGTNGIGVDTGLSATNVADAVTKKHTSGSETCTGDVSGTVGANAVDKIKGHTVDETDIGDNKLLVYKTTGDKYVYEVRDLSLYYLKTEMDEFSELQAIISDKTLINEEDAITLDNDLNMGTHKIIGVVDPVNPQEAATKAYADTKVATEVDPTVDTDAEIKAILVDEVTKTGDFTAGRIAKINNTTGIIEQGTNTDTDVADAVAKKHSQNTDTALGTMTADINMGDKNITGLGSAGFTQELDNGSKTTNFTIDFSTDQKQKATLTVNTMTLTLDTTDVGIGNYLLKIVNGGLATLTWASETGSVLFPSGEVPELTASGTDIVAFYYDGTDWYSMASFDFR